MKYLIKLPVADESNDCNGALDGVGDVLDGSGVGYGIYGDGHGVAGAFKPSVLFYLFLFFTIYNFIFFIFLFYKI